MIIQQLIASLLTRLWWPSVIMDFSQMNIIVHCCLMFETIPIHFNKPLYFHFEITN